MFFPAPVIAWVCTTVHRPDLPLRVESSGVRALCDSVTLVLLRVKAKFVLCVILSRSCPPFDWCRHETLMSPATCTTSWPY